MQTGQLNHTNIVMIYATRQLFVLNNMAAEINQPTSHLPSGK